MTAVSFKTTNTVTHSKTQHVPHSKYLLLACIPTEDKQKRVARQSSNQRNFAGFSTIMKLKHVKVKAVNKIGTGTSSTPSGTLGDKDWGLSGISRTQRSLLIPVW